jgi:hypothetical protein
MRHSPAIRQFEGVLYIQKTAINPTLAQFGFRNAQTFPEDVNLYTN